MEYTIGSLYIRTLGAMRAGQSCEIHKHNRDHVLQVLRGAIRVEAVLDDGTVIDRAYGPGLPPGTEVLIRAGVAHRLTALMDDSEYRCLFVHVDGAGAVVTTPLGYDWAYL